MKKDNGHPLPYYHAGFALMAIARVIRDWFIDSIRRVQPETTIHLETIKEYIRKTDMLLSKAKDLLEKSSYRLPQYDYEARTLYKENAYGPVNSLAQAEISLYSACQRSPIQETKAFIGG
jgi:hypothetical protein